MSRRPWSLQARLLAGVLGSVLLLWAGTLAWTWRDTRHELDELLDGHLAQSAALLVARAAAGFDDDDGLIETPLLHRYAPRVAFQVWHEGRLVLRSANAPRQPLSPLAAGFATLRLDGASWRVFGARGAEHDLQVFVGEALPSRDEILHAVLRGVLGPLALALPLLALLLWSAVRRGLAPLRGLSGALAARQPQALQPLASAGAPAEMQPLLAALNGLFERIAALLETERRFTADAAHELRTPIAAIRTQAQVALGAAADDERRHALQQTLAGCDRAARLVEQLLMLSRLEAAPAGALAAPDLAALARGVAAELAPRALQRRQELALQAPAPCPVRGEATLLGVLLRNLIDNALRYGPEGAQVRVTLAPSDGGVELLVEDSGPGLDAADAARLGERFFRVLGSGQDGSGLGWSIVRRIAQVHGAAVAVDRSPTLGGLRVRLRFLPT